MSESKLAPLHVMLLVDLLGVMGGAEQQLYLLSRELRKRGHRITVCCLRGGELSREMSREGFHVIELGVARIYGFDGFKALFRLVRYTRREKVDALITYHESSDYMGICLALLARVPVVSSRRDMGFKLKSRHVWIYRLINLWFDHVITVSGAVMRKMMEQQWLRRGHVTVVPNGVELLPVSRASEGQDDPFGVEPGCLNVCNLANIRPIKGQMDLVESAGKVMRNFKNARFYLVGKRNPDDPYCGAVERRVRDVGAEAVVKLTDELPRSEVHSFLGAMDICVCSSLSEGMSNAILEAMSAGKPVVATAVGGNPELVEDGKTGYLVPPGDSDAMAAALGRLLTDRDLARRMGACGRARVEGKFGIAGMVDHYEDILQYVHLRRVVLKGGVFRKRLANAFASTRPWIRTLVASVVYRSGLEFACRRLKRMFRLGRVGILCLHDVSERAYDRTSYAVYMPPEAFFEFLEFLQEQYEIVSLEKAIHLMKEGRRVREDVFAITFDDCYKGWVNHVLPECRRRGIPYTIFVTTGPLGSGQPLAYDILVELAEKTWRKVADLSPWGMETLLLETQDDIKCLVETIDTYFIGKTKEVRDRVLVEMSEYFGVPLDAGHLQRSVLNWDDLRELSRNGVTIGAHSVHHTCLPEMETGEVKREICESKRMLQEGLGRTVQFFAYPYGLVGPRPESLTRIVADAGYVNAFTLNVGNRREFRPFEVDRRGVSRGMFLTPNGKFHESLLATELCGLGDILFRRFSFLKKTRRSVPYS